MLPLLRLESSYKKNTSARLPAPCRFAEDYVFNGLSFLLKSKSEEAETVITDQLSQCRVRDTQTFSQMQHFSWTNFV